MHRVRSVSISGRGAWNDEYWNFILLFISSYIHSNLYLPVLKFKCFLSIPLLNKYNLHNACLKQISLFINNVNFNVNKKTRNNYYLRKKKKTTYQAHRLVELPLK